MPNILPPKITAGITLEARVKLAQFCAAEWVLTAFLRGPTVIDLVAERDTEGHVFISSAATTRDWKPGIYSYVVRAANGGDVRQIEGSTLEVLPDLAAMTDPGDMRSHARRTLDAISAVLEKRASRDQERYTINDRELWRTPIADLLKLRDVYRAEVRAEDAAARGKSLWGPAVRVRF